MVHHNKLVGLKVNKGYDSRVGSVPQEPIEYKIYNHQTPWCEAHIRKLKKVGLS